jgi:hypothetical protein
MRVGFSFSSAVKEGADDSLSLTKLLLGLDSVKKEALCEASLRCDSRQMAEHI